MILQITIGIVTGCVASTGFWTFITYLIQKRDALKTAESEMLRGIAHDRILFLGESYIKRGFITKDQYENLHDYLYVPYTKLNGNGTAKRIMDEVNKLPIGDR